MKKLLALAVMGCSLTFAAGAQAQSACGSKPDCPNDEAPVDPSAPRVQAGLKNAEHGANSAQALQDALVKTAVRKMARGDVLGPIGDYMGMAAEKMTADEPAPGVSDVVCGNQAAGEAPAAKTAPAQNPPAGKTTQDNGTQTPPKSRCVAGQNNCDIKHTPYDGTPPSGQTPPSTGDSTVGKFVQDEPAPAGMDASGTAGRGRISLCGAGNLSPLQRGRYCGQ